MPKRPFPSFLIMPGRQGRWRWNFADADGKIVAISRQGHEKPAACVQEIQAMQPAARIPILVHDVVFRRIRLASTPAAPPTEIIARQVDEAEVEDEDMLEGESDPVLH